MLQIHYAGSAVVLVSMNFVLFCFFNITRQRSLFRFDLFNMLLTDMDIAKMVLREEKRSSEWMGLKSSSSGRKLENDRRPCSETQVLFALLYADMMSELQRQGEAKSLCPDLKWKTFLLLSGSTNIQFSSN